MNYLDFSNHVILPFCPQLQFSSAINAPSSELQMADVQRCKGFVEHFARLYVNQRSQLAQATEHYTAWRTLTSDLRNLSVTSIPPQTEAINWRVRFLFVIVLLISPYLKSCNGEYSVSDI